MLTHVAVNFELRDSEVILQILWKKYNVAFECQNITDTTENGTDVYLRAEDAFVRANKI